MWFKGAQCFQKDQTVYYYVFDTKFAASMALLNYV